MGTVEDEIVSLCFFKGIGLGAINPFIDTLPATASKRVAWRFRAVTTAFLCLGDVDILPRHLRATSSMDDGFKGRGRRVSWQEDE